MEVILIMCKAICLFIAIAFSFINVVKFKAGHNISSGNNFIMSFGIAGFITLQWLL